MAAQEDPGTGSKDRATVALVAERVENLRLITEKGFDDLKRRIVALEGLPERVVRLEEKVRNLEGDGQWARTHLPALLIALAALLAAVLVPILTT